jgi:hypothetical protein
MLAGGLGVCYLCLKRMSDAVEFILPGRITSWKYVFYWYGGALLSGGVAFAIVTFAISECCIR